LILLVYLRTICFPTGKSCNRRIVHKSLSQIS